MAKGNEKKIGIHQGEMMYHDLFENNLDGICILDTMGNFIEVNVATEKLLGYSRDELYNMSVPDIIHPDDLKTSRQYMIQLAKEGSYSNYEGRLITKEGRIKHIQVNSKALYDDAKNFIGSVDTLRDITEKKEAEDLLRESEERFRNIVSHSEAIIFIIDKEGYFTLSEGKGLSVLGLQPGQVVGQSALEIYKDYPDIINGIKSALKDQVIADIIDVGGISFKTFFSPFKPSGASVEGVIGMAIDITERVKAQQDLQLHSQVISRMREGLVIVRNDDAKIIYTNKQFAELFGYQQEELLGKLVFDLVAPSNESSGAQVHEQILSNTQEAKSFVGELLQKRKDGSEFWNKLSVTPFKSEQYGEISVGICEDISEWKKTETELRRAKQKAEESDKLKTAFLANVSHEIRTPMNAIIGFSQLLKDTSTPENVRNEYISIINEKGNELLKILSDIIDISRIESGELRVNKESFDTTEFIVQLHKKYSRELGIKDESGLDLRMNVPKTPGQNFINTDKHRLTQIFGNLFQNAIKFTESGYIEIGYEIFEGQVRFFVKDTGIGISNDMKEVIFERFRQIAESTTRKYGGTGLGLTITRSLVKMLGGEMHMESDPGIGSAFYFTLPGVRSVNPLSKEPTFQEYNTETRQTNLEGTTILVVEDETANFLYLEAVLVKAKGMVIWAKDGESSITTLQNHKDIDVVLMDIAMPGINGFETVEQIRKFNDSVIIIAQTAYAQPEDERKAIEAGCNGFIAKPIPRDKLLNLILELKKVKQ